MDIVPLLRCMSDLGRLEDTMYLSMFAMEEAKHTDMFRRWFDAVGIDPASLDDLVRARNEAIRATNGSNPVGGLFDGVLTTVMRRLDTDQSPEAILDATLVYNQLVEGVAAIAGYQRLERDVPPARQAPRPGSGNQAHAARRATPHCLWHLSGPPDPRRAPGTLGVHRTSMEAAHRRFRGRVWRPGTTGSGAPRLTSTRPLSSRHCRPSPRGAPRRGYHASRRRRARRLRRLSCPKSSRPSRSEVWGAR